MGLTASATCELTFGQHGTPAVGYLVGDTHEGIVQMFKIMEFARMAVGGKAIATLSTGYLNALEFAKTRVQGSDLTQMTNKTAPKVTILHHPDVRRSLLMQKCYAEGLRAVYLYTAAHQDDVVAELVSGADADVARRVNDLLLPIVKGVGSERSYQYLAESLQTLGGSGYLKDYPLEQYVRDAKIDSLYEGTTAIQAQDFFFRKIARDRGVALEHVLGQIRGLRRTPRRPTRIGHAPGMLATAAADVQAMVATLTGYYVAAEYRRPRGVPRRTAVGAVPARRRRPADRLAAAVARRDRAVGARRSALGPGPRLLPRKGHGRNVLRDQRAAAAERRPPGRSRTPSWRRWTWRTTPSDATLRPLRRLLVLSRSGRRVKRKR